MISAVASLVAWSMTTSRTVERFIAAAFRRRAHGFIAGALARRTFTAFQAAANAVRGSCAAPTS